MVVEQQIYQKVGRLSPRLKKEVLDFVEFTLMKHRAKRLESVPVFGCAKGKIVMSADFDAPLADFKEYMQ